VGIVVTSDRDKDTWTGFGIPIEVIRQYWPKLELSASIKLLNKVGCFAS
jgi:hypothetical protein